VRTWSTTIVRRNRLRHSGPRPCWGAAVAASGVPGGHPPRGDRDGGQRDGRRSARRGAAERTDRFARRRRPDGSASVPARRRAGYGHPRRRRCGWADLEGRRRRRVRHRYRRGLRGVGRAEPTGWNRDGSRARRGAGCQRAQRAALALRGGPGPDRPVRDPSRTLRAMDPLLREMDVSLGCALENLVLAGPPNGLAPIVGLLPDPGDRTHVRGSTSRRRQRPRRPCSRPSRPGTPTAAPTRPAGR